MLFFLRDIYLLLVAIYFFYLFDLLNYKLVYFYYNITNHAVIIKNDNTYLSWYY